MAAKRPTGELPKRISKAAKAIKNNPLGMTGNKYNTLTPSAAAGYAGKMRDQLKKKTAMGQSAKSHQKDLVKISGMTAATNKYRADSKKQGGPALYREDKPDAPAVAAKKAAKKTAASFKKSR